MIIEAHICAAAECGRWRDIERQLDIHLKNALESFCALLVAGIDRKGAAARPAQSLTWQDLRGRLAPPE